MAAEHYYDYILWDTMTSDPYTGNPTPVIILSEETWPADIVLQCLATELNASETTFVLQGNDDCFEVRFFTPTHEEQMCGHGAIGAALTLSKQARISNGRCMLKAVENRVIEVEVSSTAPGQPAQAVMRFAEDPVNRRLGWVDKLNFAAALSCDPSEIIHIGRNHINDIVVELASTRDFSAAALKIDAEKVLLASPEGTRSQIITGRGSDGADFFKRVFAFGSEDQGTGSTYAALVPHWGSKLGKADLTCRQVSRRGASARLHWDKANGKVIVHAEGVEVGRGRLLDPTPSLQRLPQAKL